MFFFSKASRENLTAHPEIPGLRFSAFLVNGMMAVMLIPTVAWLAIYLVASPGDPEQVLVRSGLLFIALLLVATSLSNALFLLRPPAVVRKARSAIRVLNVVSLAILFSLATPVWVVQADGEFIDAVMTSARHAERAMQVAIVTFAPIIVIGLGYTQLHRRSRLAGLSAGPA
jgi:hypothetical protein